MLTLRGLTFDAAAPRIIVPLFARSLGALRPLAAAADADPAAEVVELRLDPLPEVDFSAALALVLTVIVTVQPTLAEMFFGPVTLELKGVVAALGLAFLIIPLMEIYKAIMRAVEKE